MVSPFDILDGIIEVKSGYIGGHIENPTYADVKSQKSRHYEAIKITYDPTQKSRHYEAIKITYDPTKISYDKLLNVYWMQIDPMDNGGQFHDRGESYRTAIFYTSESQKQAAKKSKKMLDESGRFPKPIVTKILPATTFYLTEEYHQDFYRKQPVEYKKDRSISGRDEFIRKYWGDQYYSIFE
ncbi:peptide methionine sulfoxide reductase MsrA [Clostridium tepidiprofundi DSM 19306]|uniref:Peptide methionine sulfoxide reductase MsrA n=2 Tax=Clostridium TaxID=1485 RepID=A0A151B2N0_9CLOT|nr:peptide methionine sulfoxide reductase MsrA [Clostridium tepidiprofundi DSM 19306]